MHEVVIPCKGQTIPRTTPIVSIIRFAANYGAPNLIRPNSTPHIAIPSTAKALASRCGNQPIRTETVTESRTIKGYFFTSVDSQGIIRRLLQVYVITVTEVYFVTKIPGFVQDYIISGRSSVYRKVACYCPACQRQILSCYNIILQLGQSGRVRRKRYHPIGYIIRSRAQLYLLGIYTAQVRYVGKMDSLGRVRLGKLIPHGVYIQTATAFFIRPLVFD